MGCCTAREIQDEETIVFVKIFNGCLNMVNCLKRWMPKLRKVDKNLLFLWLSLKSHNMDTVLITGINSGMGFATARKLLQLGYSIIGTVRNQVNSKANLDILAHKKMGS